MKRLLRTSILALFFFLPALSQAASRIEYILDVSGSMNALSGGDKRIDSARKAIAAAMQGVPDGSIVALRLYAHRIAPSDKEKSCKDTELVVPFGPVNKQQIIGIVNGANPLGQTPIAYSLEQAANDFTLGADEQQTIILVSDGEESCGGDPVAVAKALIAKGFKIKIDVIGMDVDPNAKNQLSSIASVTGGQYFDAKDAASLSSSLQKLTQESLVIQKAGSSVYGEEIRGGDNFETAVPLPPAKLFRLNHHQKRNQYDYFYIEAKPGQKIIASLETGEKGVNIKDDNTYEETLNPYAGMSLQSPQKTQIQTQDIIGDKNSSRQIAYSVPIGGQGRYYILIGSAYDNQHKDHRFKVEMASQFDAGTQQDAGETRDSALAIQPGTIKGYLNPNDSIDAYKVQLPAGPLNVKMRVSSEKVRARLELFDADGVHVADQSSPNEGAVVKLENVQLTKPGEYILKAESAYSGPAETEYTLEITPGSGAAPSTDAGAPPAPPAPGTPPTAEAPPPPPPPAAPPPPPPVEASGSNTSTPVMKPLPFPGGGVVTAKDLCEEFKRMPFMEKAKAVLFYCGIPLVAGFLIGWIWGYIKGRKTGKRKAAQAQLRAQAPPPPPPPPPSPPPPHQ